MSQAETATEEALVGSGFHAQPGKAEGQNSQPGSGMRSSVCGDSGAEKRVAGLAKLTADVSVAGFRKGTLRVGG